MDTDLRPRSLGEILDRTAELYRTNFLLLAGISAVYAGALLVLNLFSLGAKELLKAQQMSAQLPWVTVGFAVLIVPLIVVLAGAEVAANNRAVAWVHMGQPATIRSAYRSVFQKLGRYLWLMTIITFVIYIPFVVLFGAYFGYLFAHPGFFAGMAAPGAHGDPRGTATFAAVTGVVFLLAIPAMLYAVLMGLRYSLAVPAAVVEDIKARQALRRSIDLSKGARGRIFVLVLLIVAIQMGLGLIAQAPFFVAVVRYHGHPPITILALQQIANFFINTLVGPIYATGITLFYYDQRVRKEGFDILWMMQAAGLTAPQGEAEKLPEPAVAPAADPVILPGDAPDPGSRHE